MARTATWPAGLQDRHTRRIMKGRRWGSPSPRYAADGPCDHCNARDRPGTDAEAGEIMTARAAHRSESVQAGPPAPVMAAYGRKPTVVVEGLQVI